MTMKFHSGNMFHASTEAIVNTVNCVGVMGKGVALEFKKRWPKNYDAYRQLCKDGKVKTGKMFVFENTDMFDKNGHRFLINFPTKKHWRSKSKLSYIEEGLDDFVVQVRKYGIKSVAIPPLGCGNGGLDWAVVKALMEEKLSPVKNVEFWIFAPASAEQTPEFTNIPDGMTAPRAVLVKTLGDFEAFFGGHFTRLSIQKIVYFLQALGVNFSLQFQKDQFGPYSEILHNALQSLEESNYIDGYTSQTSETRVSSASYASAEEYLKENDWSRYNKIIEKLSHLIEGYESPFGLELLASVHYLYQTEQISSKEDVLAAFKNWNSHKHSSFGEIEVSSAIARLKEDELIQ